jgi:hypothetical protein
LNAAVRKATQMKTKARYGVVWSENPTPRAMKAAMELADMLAAMDKPVRWAVGNGFLLIREGLVLAPLPFNREGAGLGVVG